MEKNETNCPKVVCEKIYRAITLAPAFTTIRRISKRQRALSPAAAKHTRNSPSEVPIKFDYTTGHLPNPLETEKPKPKTAALSGSTSTYINGTQAVPLMAQWGKTPMSWTDMAESGKGKPIVLVNGQQAVGSKLKQHQGKEEAGNKPTQQHYDARFDAFIHQTREKIMSDDRQDNQGNSHKMVGHGHGHGHVSFRKEHHFSDLINQTLRKIKSTLSMKDRGESIK